MRDSKKPAAGSCPTPPCGACAIIPQKPVFFIAELSRGRLVARLNALRGEAAVGGRVNTIGPSYTAWVSPAKSEKRNPCARYEMSPMFQAAQKPSRRAVTARLTSRRRQRSNCWPRLGRGRWPIDRSGSWSGSGRCRTRRSRESRLPRIAPCTPWCCKPIAPAGRRLPGRAVQRGRLARADQDRLSRLAGRLATVARTHQGTGRLRTGLPRHEFSFYRSAMRAPEAEAASLLSLLEIPQGGRRLALADRHQAAVGRAHIVFPADDHMMIVLGANIL